MAPAHFWNLFLMAAIVSFPTIKSDTQCYNITLWANSNLSILTSPNYPDNYTSNTDCLWHIVAQPSDLVVLNLLEFYLPPLPMSADVVTIYDGSNTNAPIIRVLRGSQNATTFVSSLHTLTLRFQSFNSYARRGFKFVFTTMSKSDSNGTKNLIANETELIFTSPFYNQIYRGVIDCQWIITAVKTSGIVILNVIDFTIDNSFSTDEYIAIFDGNGTNSSRQGILYDSTSNATFTSTGQTITVVYSLRYRHDIVGLKMTYRMLDYPDQCNNSNLWASEQTKYITSPGYPNNITSNTNCHWYISASVLDYVVELSVIDLQLDGNMSHCLDQNVSMYDGNNEVDLIDVLCGHLSNGTYTSTDRSMTVVFNSNSMKSVKGFKLQYKSLYKTALCGNSELLANGTETYYLTSPRYPYPYPNNIFCRWVIQSPFTESIIRWKFMDFELDGKTNGTCQDTLSLEDGTSYITIGPYVCGSITQDKPTYSTSNAITLYFSSEVAGHYKGFKLQYTAVNTSDLCGSSSLIADGSNKTLNSPFYPNSYPSKITCTWQITASSPTKAVLLNVVAFRVYPYNYGGGCASNYVSIYDVESGTKQKRYTLCQTVTNEQFISAGPAMLVQFHSESGITLNGFSFQYTEHDKPDSCSGINLTATRDDQYITSPNYPYWYPSNTDCIWRIKSEDKSLVINVHFETADLNDGDYSCYDYISIYDGNSEQSSRLKQNCGNYYSYSDVISTGSNITIVFHTDDSTAGKGFNLTYYATKPTKPWSYSYTSLSDYKIAGIVISGITGVVALARILVYAIAYWSGRRSRLAPVSTRQQQQERSQPRTNGSQTTLGSSNALTTNDRFANYATQYDPPSYSSLSTDNLNLPSNGESNNTNLPPAYSTKLSGGSKYNKEMGVDSKGI